MNLLSAQKWRFHNDFWCLFQLLSPFVQFCLPEKLTKRRRIFIITLNKHTRHLLQISFSWRAQNTFVYLWKELKTTLLESKQRHAGRAKTTKKIMMTEKRSWSISCRRKPSGHFDSSASKFQGFLSGVPPIERTIKNEFPTICDIPGSFPSKRCHFKTIWNL